MRNLLSGTCNYALKPAAVVGARARVRSIVGSNALKMFKIMEKEQTIGVGKSGFIVHPSQCERLRVI